MAELGSCSDNNNTSKVHDSVCMTFDGVSVVPQTIWTNESNFVINGTVLVENDGSPLATPAQQSVFLTIPGIIADLEIPVGESRAVTANHLESIVIFGGSGAASPTKVSFSLNYKF